MVKNKHNHTPGSSEMLIRVASELDFLSTKSRDLSIRLQDEFNISKM